MDREKKEWIRRRKDGSGEEGMDREEKRIDNESKKIEKDEKRGWGGPKIEVRSQKIS